LLVTEDELMLCDETGSGGELFRIEKFDVALEKVNDIDGGFVAWSARRLTCRKRHDKTDNTPSNSNGTYTISLGEKMFVFVNLC
jgi:hypothetical protein